VHGQIAKEVHEAKEDYSAAMCSTWTLAELLEGKGILCLRARYDRDCLIVTSITLSMLFQDSQQDSQPLTMFSNLLTQTLTHTEERPKNCGVFW